MVKKIFWSTDEIRSMLPDVYKLLNGNASPSSRELANAFGEAQKKLSPERHRSSVRFKSATFRKIRRQLSGLHGHLVKTGASLSPSETPGSPPAPSARQRAQRVVSVEHDVTSTSPIRVGLVNNSTFINKLAIDLVDDPEFMQVISERVKEALLKKL